MCSFESCLCRAPAASVPDDSMTIIEIGKHFSSRRPSMPAGMHAVRDDFGSARCGIANGWRRRSESNKAKAGMRPRSQSNLPTGRQVQSTVCATRTPSWRSLLTDPPGRLARPATCPSPCGPNGKDARRVSKTCFAEESSFSKRAAKFRCYGGRGRVFSGCQAGCQRRVPIALAKILG